MKSSRSLLSTFTIITLVSVVTTASGAPKTVALPEKITQEVIEVYARNAQALYAKTLDEARQLQSQLKALSKDPSDKSLLDAKEAWKKARDVYSRTEALRFYGGPIDDPDTGPEGLLNAWPLDESYIDYVSGHNEAGVIQNRKAFPKITKDILVSLNEKDGEKNISTGFHAIEFLLWGQDLSLEGPGQRPLSDFQKINPKINSTAERRLTYLNLLGDLLVEHLSKVAKGWDFKDPKSYANSFVREAPGESIRRIYVGVTNLLLDEMAGERMTVSLERNDPENEQDCFSDYTLQDARSNLAGVADVLRGSYGAEKRMGLIDLIRVGHGEARAKRIETLLADAEAKLDRVKNLPFDRIIKNPESHADRKATRAVMTALEKLSQTIAATGKGFGLILNVE